MLLVGTKGGLYTFTLRNQSRWVRAGPFLKGWDVPDLGVSDGVAYAAVDNRKAKFGKLVGAVFRSRDPFRRWERTGFVSLWPHPFTLGVRGRTVYVGLEPPAVGRSLDGGRTWREVGSFREVPGSFEWWGPGDDARCFVSALLLDPKNPRRIWVGMSGGGLWRTDDGLRTWSCAARGLGGKLGKDAVYGETQIDVHAAAEHAVATDVLYMGNHGHVRISTNGGRTWRLAEGGLPPCEGYKVPVIRNLAVHPRDWKRAFTVPLPWSRKGVPALKGQIGVARTADGGRNWDVVTKGLPTAKDVNVYRHSMDADQGDPSGVYFGTNSGDLYGSLDEGDSWAKIGAGLPRIRAVATSGT